MFDDIQSEAYPTLCMKTSIDTFDKKIILYNINGTSKSRRLIYLMEVVVAASEHHQTSHTCLTKDFLALVPDRTNSQLYTDMKDMFAYVQIEKGATALAKTIPLEDIATLCRALGFYPTEREIEDMMNEVDVLLFRYI